MDGWGLLGTTYKVSFIILWCSLLICGTENITYVFWWIGTTEEIRVSSSSNKTLQLIMTFFIMALKHNSAQLASPWCQVSIPQATNSTPPRQYCQIVKSKFALWTAHGIKKILGCPMSTFFFRSAETSAQKNQTLSKFKLPSKLNSNILKANWKVLSSHFIFSLHPLLWTMWIKNHLNRTKFHPWNSWKMKFI